MQWYCQLRFIYKPISHSYITSFYSPIIPTTITGSGNLDYIQLLKKPGGSLADSFLEEGFVLNKSFGIGQVLPTLFFPFLSSLYKTEDHSSHQHIPLLISQNV